MNLSKLGRRLILPLCLIAAPIWADVPDPMTQLQVTADLVLSAVSQRKQELTETPSKIYPLVEQIVLPKFDFERMGRLVLGKNWNSATPQQQQDFVKEFRELLVRTYATALLNYSGQKIDYKSARLEEGNEKATVDTQVSDGGAPPIPIVYRLYLKGEQWLIYDVSIDGVSLVSNYRTSFESQIRKVQLQGLIDKLAQQNKQGARD